MVVVKGTIVSRNFELIQYIKKKNDVIYLGDLITNKGYSEQEIKRRIGMMEDGLEKIIKYGKTTASEKKQKKRLVQALNYSIATYGSESWTINAAYHNRIEAFEINCYRRMLRVSYSAHRTNISLLRDLKIQPLSRYNLLASIQRRILIFVGTPHYRKRWYDETNHKKKS